MRREERRDGLCDSSASRRVDHVQHDTAGLFAYCLPATTPTPAVIVHCPSVWDHWKLNHTLTRHTTHSFINHPWHHPTGPSITSQFVRVGFCMKSRSSKALQHSYSLYYEDLWFYSRLCNVCQQNHFSLKYNASDTNHRKRDSRKDGAYEKRGNCTSIRLREPLRMGYRSR